MRAETGYSATARTHRGRTLLGAVFLLILSGMGVDVRAQAPGPPPAGSVAPLIAPPVQRVLPPEQPEIAPQPAPTVEVPEPPPVGPPVRVDRVRIEGVTVYDDATLRALYSDVVGTTAPRAQLDEIAQSLQTRYREDGYILTLVRGNSTGRQEVRSNSLFARSRATSAMSSSTEISVLQACWPCRCCKD